MAEIAQSVATVLAGIFAGAAVYINVAEHPARLECGTSLASTVFGPSYRRAAVMQASLAILGTVAGVIAWLGTRDQRWLWGSAFLFFVVPFTFVAIMPTNKRLLDPGLKRSSSEANALLVKWGRLHAVRSVAGVLSFVLFVVAAHP